MVVVSALSMPLFLLNSQHLLASIVAVPLPIVVCQRCLSLAVSSQRNIDTVSDTLIMNFTA